MPAGMFQGASAMGEDQHYAATTTVANTAVMSDESAHLDTQCAADTSTVR